MEFLLYALRTCRVPDYFPMPLFEKQWREATRLQCEDKLVVVLQEFYTRFKVAPLFRKNGSRQIREFLTSVLMVHLQYRETG